MAMCFSYNKNKYSPMPTVPFAVLCLEWLHLILIQNCLKNCLKNIKLPKSVLCAMKKHWRSQN